MIGREKVTGNLTPPGRLAADEPYCGPWKIQRTKALDIVPTLSRNGSDTSRPGEQAATPRSLTAKSMDFPVMRFSTGSRISREMVATGL
jgi:hypothetical protein